MHKCFPFKYMNKTSHALFLTKLFLFLQLFHADQRLQVFPLRASGFGLISLDAEDIESVKSDLSILHSKLKACNLPPQW